ncbi:MAG: WG repeat-containing protein [Desulfobacterales bacterium]|nr:MAG: WG repeat-containing protein [Desulfobacterales bacterium]
MNIIILEITMIARSFYILTVLVLLGLMSTGIGEAKPDGPFYPVKENGLWGYINPSGSVVIKPKFAHGESFKHALARVKVGNLLAYLNKEGTVVWKAKE